MTDKEYREYYERKLITYLKESGFVVNKEGMYNSNGVYIHEIHAHRGVVVFSVFSCFDSEEWGDPYATKRYVRGMSPLIAAEEILKTKHKVI